VTGAAHVLAMLGAKQEDHHMDADEVERLSIALFLSDQRKGLYPSHVLWGNTEARRREHVGEDTHYPLNDQERESFRDRVRAGERASDA
jgi:hypothetical protein